MSVVTNYNFAHRGLVAFSLVFVYLFLKIIFFVIFCIFFALTMKISGMSLHAMEFDNFFFPFVRLLGEW